MIRQLAAACCLLVLSPSPAPGQEGAPVRLGARALFEVRVSADGRTPEERATRAAQVLEDAADDPDCDPENLEALPEEDGTYLLRVCDRTILRVTPQDAAEEGTTPEALVRAWSRRIVSALDAEKQARYATRLLQRGIVGFLIPLAYLLGIWLIGLLFRRLESPPPEPEGASGESRSRWSRLSAALVERSLLLPVFRLLRWTAYGILTYVFLIILFRQFPRTRQWAWSLLQPLLDLTPKLAVALPRLVLAVLVLVLVRLLLVGVGRLFDQVEQRKIRVEPFLSPETAGPAELTARVLVLALGLLLVGLLMPGEAGFVLLAVFGLAAFAVAVGAWDATSNFVAGLITLYGRPFRRGHRIRTRNLEGLVVYKGIFHVRLETDEGRLVLVPNRSFLRQPWEIVRRERALFLRVMLKATPEIDKARSLLLHAAAESGLKRDEGHVTLLEVRHGHLVFELEWPLPKGETAASCRYRFLQSLMKRSEGMEVEVVSVHPLIGTHPHP